MFTGDIPSGVDGSLKPLSFTWLSLYLYFCFTQHSLEKGNTNPEYQNNSVCKTKSRQADSDIERDTTMEEFTTFKMACFSLDADAK